MPDPKFKGFGTNIQRWGGSTAAFFSYTHLAVDMCIGLLAAMLPLIRVGLGLSYLQAGLLLSAYTVTAGLCQIPGGWISDRVNRQLVIAVVLSGVGLTSLAVGLNSAYYPMLATLVVLGMFAGGYHPSAVPLLSGSIEGGRRGKAIALFNVGGSAGFLLGPVLGGLIGNTIGWRFAFIILSIPALTAVPFLIKKLRKHKTTSQTASVNKEDKNGVSELVIRRDITFFQALRAVAGVLVLVSLTSFVSGAAIAFIPIYMVDKHGIAPALAAMFLGINRGGGILGSLLGGWLSDKWGRKNTILLALLANGASLYFLTRLPFGGAFIVILVLFGAVVRARGTSLDAFIMDSVPPYFRATIFGIYFGLTQEGLSLLQPIAGHFMDVFGINQVFDFIALISVVLSLCALLLLRRGEKQQPKRATT